MYNADKSMSLFNIRKNLIFNSRAFSLPDASMTFLLRTKTADTHFPESEAAAAAATLPKKEKQTNKQTNKQTTCVGVYLPSTRSTTQNHHSQNLENKQHTHKHMHTYIPTCDDDLFFFFFFSIMMINMKQISKTRRKFLSPFSSPACNPVTPASSLSFRRKRSFSHQPAAFTKISSRFRKF
jgi:hypothetical protein